MRITDLKVDGFGAWRDLELAELSDELNVFYGPNEAGKTTLMQFVRSVLYGFSTSRRQRYLPPVSGGRPGGTLELSAADAEYAVSRHADDATELGAVVVAGEHRQGQTDERVLAELLGEIDEPTFSNVFAFGLTEIQELATLSDTQAAKELYNLSLGLDRVSLVDVLGELETSRIRLLAPDDRPSVVTQLLSQRQRLQGELDELGHATVRYLTISSERAHLDETISDLEAQGAELEKQARELALVRSLAERWRRRQAIDRDLAAMGIYEGLPDDALEQFDRLGARLATRRRRFARLKKLRGQLRGQIAELKINEPLCRNAMRLEALDEQRPWIESLEGQVAQLGGEIADLKAQLEASRRQLGIEPTAPGGRVEPLSKSSLGELRAAAKALAAARREAEPLRQQVAARAEAADSRKRQIEAAMGAAKVRDLTQALADAGERVTQLRTRVQLDDRLDQMIRSEADLKEQGHDEFEGQMLSGWVLAGLGSVFALGSAMVLLYLAGVVLPTSYIAAMPLGVALVGGVSASVAAATKVALEHRATGNSDATRQQAQVLSQQIRQGKTQRDELDEVLPRGGGPLVVRLQTAEKELAALEALVPLQSQHDTARQDAEAAARQEQTLVEIYQQRRKAWRRLLAAAGLPADLHPRQLGDFAERSDQLRGLYKTFEQKTEELKRRKVEYDTLAARITQLVTEVGLASRSARPLDQLQQGLLELGEQQVRLKRRAELTEQLVKLRRRRIKLTRGAASLRRQRRRLLQAAGTADEAEFRRRAVAQAETKRLAAERAQLAQEITLALAGQSTEEALARRLSAPDNLEMAELELDDTRQTATQKLSEALVRRGEMNQQLKALVDDRQLAHKRIELDIVEKRLHDALGRWRVLSVCSLMLDAVRQYYEREHQPQALREASTYLERLTGGRYTRVWTSLADHALRVDDAGGHTLPVEVLSRGTREQLFLALRLALVSSYARRGVDLPLVLDDVLVNFDVGRAKAAAAVLRDFSRLGHQLLVFTCHEHISKLFKNIKAEVRLLPEHGQRVPPAEEPPVRRPRRVRPEPEPEPEVEVVAIVEPEPEVIELAPPVAEVVPPLAVEVKPVVIVAPPPPVVIAPPPPRVVMAPPPPPVVVPPPPKAPPLPPLIVNISPPPMPVVAAPPPATPAPPIAAPPPTPAPVVRTRPRTKRVDWSAEEFDGELADRVWYTELVEDVRGDADDMR